MIGQMREHQNRQLEIIITTNEEDNNTNQQNMERAPINIQINIKEITADKISRVDTAPIAEENLRILTKKLDTGTLTKIDDCFNY